MAPLPLPHAFNKPSGEKVLEIAGNLRVTSMKMAAPSEYKNGSLSVYKSNKNEFTCYIASSHRPSRTLKLTKNIKTVTAKGDRLTVVLHDQHQILGSNFVVDQLKALEVLFQNIQFGKVKDTDGLSSSSSKVSHSWTKKSAFSEDSKENLHRGSPQPVKSLTNAHTPKRTPLTEQDRPFSGLSSPASETPNRPSLLRDQSNAPRQRLLVSPFSKRSSPQAKEGLASTNKNTSPEFGIKRDEESKIKTGSFYGGSSSLSSYVPGKYFSEVKPKPRNLEWGSPQPKRSLSSALSFSMRERQKSIWSGFNSSVQLTGFSNLGNTCYMNAILQCLLGMPTFAYDLSNKGIVNNASSSSLYRYRHKCLVDRLLSQGYIALRLEKSFKKFYGRYQDLIEKYQRCLYNLLLSKKFEKSLEKQRSILKEIKKAISLAATRFSGYLQHDAHEFLGQCLDQLKEDVNKIVTKPEQDGDDVKAIESSEEKQVKDSVCPVGRNFECGILHTIQCKSCKDTITKEEVFHDFSLDIPEIDENTNPDDSSLQDLLWSYFEDESVEYTCEKCGFGDARLSHHFNRLPRIIILHLKRYGYDADLSKNNKKLDKVDIPKEINLGILCNENTSSPVPFRQKNESSPTKLAKRSLQEEPTPDDLEDFQPSFKVRRKLDLPTNTRTSTPSRANSNSFSNRIKTESRFDPLTMTEDEQLEWAIKESSRTYGFETPEPLNSSESKRKHRVKITPDLLETNEALALDSEGFVSNTSIFKGDNESENNKSFTRLRTPNEKTEADIIETSDKDHDLLHCDTQNQNKEANEGHAMNWFSNTDKDHGKDNSMYSAATIEEGIDVPDDEDEQLKMALEISLQEFNKIPTPEESRSGSMREKKRRSNECKQALASCNVPPKKYVLVGIVSHMGDKVNSGHYVCDVYNCKAQQWRSYNDTAVKEVTEYEVRYGRKESAYIFFYLDEDSFKSISPEAKEKS